MQTELQDNSTPLSEHVFSPLPFVRIVAFRSAKIARAHDLFLINRIPVVFK